MPDIEDEDIMFVLNLGSYVPKNTASHHVRLDSTSCGLHILIVDIAGLTIILILPVT